MQYGLLTRYRYLKPGVHPKPVCSAGEFIKDLEIVNRPIAMPGHGNGWAFREFFAYVKLESVGKLYTLLEI